MKFACKLTLCIVLLLATVLSLGGFFMISKDFDRALAQAGQQNTISHLREKYALEIALLQMDPSQSDHSYQNIYQYGEQLMNYVGADTYRLAIYVKGNASVFSNLPLEIKKATQLELVEQGERVFRLCKTEDACYMLLASPVSSPVDGTWIVSAHPVTSLFAARNAQIQSFLGIELVALSGASIAALVLSILLTKPMQALELTSRRIAAGAFGERTRIRTQDEIGALSQSFDAMADAVEHKINALHASLQQRNDFVAAFTHELKTPMTSMLGYADLLRTGEQEEETKQKAANYIYHEAKRLELLSHKLMILMKLEQTERIQLTPVRLGTVQLALARCFPPERAPIAVSFPPDIAVMADRELLVDLLCNLITNGIKASASGSTVWVAAVQGQDGCVLTVRDSGCGIPEHELARITEPFYMADKSRAHAQNGSGIGLALCQKIAELHGTSLQISSQVGKGTTVQLTLTPEKEAPDVQI